MTNHPSILLLDAHLHLQESIFSPHLPAILARAQSAGVTKMVCNGTTESDWPRVRQLAQFHPDTIIPCFGLHPWYVSDRSPHWLTTLETHLTSLPSAIGEIGLDRWLEPRDEPAQEHVFRAQLSLARKLNRPVMIHCLRAWGWLLDVLASEPPLPAGMLIHAYGGSVETIAPLAARGAYFSFAGNVFEPKRTKARQALAAVPLDRLLLETDAPDMPPPPPFRLHVLQDSTGKVYNEPANLRLILRGAADLRAMPESDLAQTLWTNARRFLGDLLH